MALSEAERTQRLREKRAAKGWKRKEFWVTDEEAVYLKMQLDLLRSQAEKSRPK